ncbi:MAG TPA: enoyl-CoA hydratase/isomerase family protein [Casimicrobiaceae bacterium]|nr:enoyl-CoA hydratase/isomerase family protein [Casimicrobiaceae bacterium]
MSAILLDQHRRNVAVITINRPQRRNALDGDAWRDLGDAFNNASANADLRAVVLTGAGGHFCAGDDIVAFSRVRDDPPRRAVYWNSIMDCYAAIARVPVPVIAAINGVCVGGGCTIALRSDFRIAHRSARFGIPPAKLGLVYPAESTRLLVAIAGVTVAKRLLYTGDILDAAEAHGCGLASAIAEGDVVEAALAFAEPILANAPISLAALKLICDAIVSDRVDEVRDEFEDLFRRADASEDSREGARAFAEKRPPRFTGR